MAAHQELVSEAEAISRTILGGIAFEDVANDVADSIRSLDMDDLNSRAGRHSWGYVEPAEAAWELVEEAVNPFVDSMKRHLKLGLPRESFELLKGIVLGLYRCRKAEGHDFLGWAEDCPAETAGFAIDTWLVERTQAQDCEALLREFVDLHVPEWQWILRKIGQKRDR